LLSGLQVSGQNQPSTAAMPPHAKKFTWHWWWLLAAVPVLVLIVLSALVATSWRRRRRRRDAAAYAPDRDLEAAGYPGAADGRWGHDDADFADEHFTLADPRPAEHEPPADEGPAASRVSWSRGAEAYGDQVPAGFDEDARHFDDRAIDEEDPDAVDTDSIPVVSQAGLAEAGYPDVPEEPGYVEEEYPEVPVGAGYVEEGYPEAGYPAGEPDAAELEPEDVAYPEAVAADDELLDAEIPEAVGAEARTGRHAALDENGFEEAVPDAGGAASAPAGRPTIHLPLDDPYQAPDGYPIKASARFGLYYTPGSELYHDTLAEIWLASEEVAQANGFIKAD
jgi:uncharacterized protein with LGFP repeats